MLFDMAAFKSQCRQALHETLAVSAFYYTKNSPKTAEPNVTVRWHSKQNLVNGSFDGEGYAQALEGVERLIFNAPQLAEAGITLDKNATIEIPWPDGTSAKLRLETREPAKGPVEITWIVVYP